MTRIYQAASISPIRGTGQVALHSRGSGLRAVAVCLGFLAASGEARFLSAGEPGPPVAQRVYTERAASLALRRAESALRSGETLEGITALQRILDSPTDVFVHSESAARGVRDEAGRLLGSASASFRATYEATRGAAASSELRRAVAVRNADLLGDVVRRFPATGAAFQASDLLARRAFDRGDFATAARLWSELLEEPRSAEWATPALLARAIAACRRAGRDGLASSLSVRYGHLPLRISGRSTFLQALPADFSSSGPPLPTTIPHAVGPRITAPAYPPVWRHVAAESALTDLWAASRRSEGRPIASPAAAVLVGDSLVLRKPTGVEAFDSRSGDPLWTTALSGRDSAGSRREFSSDLHALNRFEALHAGSSLLANMTSDSGSVYVIDRIDEETHASRRAPHSASSGPSTHGANHLVSIAARAGPSAGTILWAAGGSSGSDPTLSEHSFLGAPVAFNDRLFAITERRQCLNLVALNPATGEAVWTQPLGFVSRPLDDDEVRANAGCRPTVSQGIAVCAPHAGFIAAIDLVSRRLKWACEYAAADSDRSSDDDRTSCHGDASFPAEVLVRGGSVLVLPQDSPCLHCLDLETGQFRWSVGRDDGLSIACLTETSVIVLGRASIRGHSLASGSLLWSTRIGSPTGTGIATESAYLIPTTDGRVVAVDLATGHFLGYETPRAAQDYLPAGGHVLDREDVPLWHPGSLLTDGCFLYSVGPFGVACLEQAGARLAASESRTEPLEEARLELAMGELGKARRLLEALTTSVHEASRRESRRLLREAHYRRLDWTIDADEEAEALAELDRLSAQPAERARFLVHAAARDLMRGRSDRVPGRVQELASLDGHPPLPSPEDTTHLVTPVSWARIVLGRIEDGLPPSDALPMESLSETELRRRLVASVAVSEQADIRRELARRALRDSELHRAETLLLRAAELSGDGALARDIEGLRQPSSSGRELRPGRVENVAAVSVRGTLWAPADEGLCRIYSRSRRGFITRGEDQYRVLDVGDSRRARLAIVDLQHGVRLGEIPLDARLRFPAPSRQPGLGHFIPVATAERIYGISLLEARLGEPVWDYDVPGAGVQLPQVGPYGPSFCVVQTRRELTVLDPERGHPLWRRIELPAERGLQGDQGSGLFGDEEALVLLDPDRAAYTAYRTQTGEEIDGGRLPIDPRRPRRTFGRKLFFVETLGNGQSMARLWDPGSSSYDLAIPFTGRLLQQGTRQDELVLLFEDGRLLIIDARLGRVVLEASLAAEQVATAQTLQAFSDSKRYYVSLHQPDPARFDASRVCSFYYDTPLNATHVQGWLTAIDRQSGEVIWARRTEQRSVLDPHENPFPFLVAVSRISDRSAGSRKALLIEAIDDRTGHTLGRNDTLFPDLLLQARHDWEAKRVLLAGMTSSVTLEYRSEPSDVADSVIERSPIP